MASLAEALICALGPHVPCDMQPLLSSLDSCNLEPS